MRRLRAILIAASLIMGTLLVAASVTIPIILLIRLNSTQLSRWSEIGQALSPVGIFFSGIGFVAVAVTLLTQHRELQNQHDELSIAVEEQARASEVAMRRLHTDLIKMAIEDPDLLSVWPDITPGDLGSKKDHYCNLILNLQKLAYEAHTVELAELRGALSYLMTSSDMYLFWEKSRRAHVQVTAGDAPEDLFTAEVDRAFQAAIPPTPPPVRRLRGALFTARGRAADRLRRSLPLRTGSGTRTRRTRSRPRALTPDGGGSTGGGRGTETRYE